MLVDSQIDDPSRLGRVVGCASVRRRWGRARFDSPQDACVVVVGRRPSFLGRVGHQLTTETRGQTAVWTITPERPVWGSQRLVLRSNRPLLADREVVYPEISPLGKGAVDACLAVVNATGRTATIETSRGLEQDRPFDAVSGQGVRFRRDRVIARCVSGGGRVADSQDSITPKSRGRGRFARRLGAVRFCRRVSRSSCRTVRSWVEPHTIRFPEAVRF